MSGEETTDPVPCGSAVVRTPSDAAWDWKGATVYYRRAIINFCKRGPSQAARREDAHCDQQPCLGWNRYARSSGAVHKSASRRG